MFACLFNLYNTVKNAIYIFFIKSSYRYIVTVNFAASDAGERNLASMKLRQKRSVNLGEISRSLAWLAGTEPVTDLLQLNRTRNVLALQFV